MTIWVLINQIAPVIARTLLELLYWLNILQIAAQIVYVIAARAFFGPRPCHSM